MPEEIVFQTLRPQDHRPAGQKDRMMMVRVDMRLFGEIKALCQATGYYGLDTSTTFHPDLRAGWGMLAGALCRGLEMLDRGAKGKPFDTFRVADARRKVEDIIDLAKLGLGLTFTKGPKVERINEDRATALPRPSLSPEMESCVFRPRPNAAV